MPKDLAEENEALKAEIENLRLRAEKARLERSIRTAKDDVAGWVLPVVGGVLGLVIPLGVYLLIA